MRTIKTLWKCKEHKNRHRKYRIKDYGKINLEKIIQKEKKYSNSLKYVVGIKIKILNDNLTSS